MWRPPGFATLRSSERMAAFFCFLFKAIRGSVCYATFAAEGASARLSEPRRDSGEGCSSFLHRSLLKIKNNK